MCLSLSERYALLEGRNEEIKFLIFKCKGEEFRRQERFPKSSSFRLKRKGRSLDALTVRLSTQKKISEQEAHRWSL